jgi:hypothetical protein
VKKILCLMLLAVAAVAATWYEVQVPLGAELPEALYGFDIVSIKPGHWARVVATSEDLEALNEAGIAYDIIISDLSAHYAAQMLGDGPFGNYYTCDEAAAILDSLHEAYPDIMTERMILPNDEGDMTWTEHYVWAVKISDNVEVEEDEAEVLYTGLHHAREPITVNIMVEWARWLCENYGSDPLATYLVDNRQIWIIPIINPDGYLYNEENEPDGGGMHRKNMRPVGYFNQGVDPNRNYPYMWGYDNQGSSGEPDSDTYRGPDPGSEPEVQSVMNLCKAHEFVLALNFHSHSNLFLYPWGYVHQKCDDSAAYYNWGERSTRVNQYAVIAGHELYPVNGDSDDWMYAEQGILAVTPEIGEAFWQDWQVDQHIYETRPLLIATAKAADVYPELEGVYFSDGGDDAISPGETVDLLVRVHNMSVKKQSGEIALELFSNDPRVDLVVSTASIPSLDPQTGGANQAHPLKVKLSSSAQPDSAISLTLTIRTASDEFVHHILLPVGERLYLIDEDFDDQNTEGWLSNWGLSAQFSHSPDYSITDSPAGSYGNNSTYYLQSPKLDLSDKVTAKLSFWHRFAIEKGFDWGGVQITSSDIDGWLTLKRFSGEDANQWAQEMLDLSEYCGAGDFYVRFVLITDQGLTTDGWYVDNILLTAFKGKASSSGLHELVDIRPALGPRESITAGALNFIGPEGVSVEVAMFDESGRKVAETEGVTPFGWNISDRLSTGVYFIKTVSADAETTRKVVLVKE